jgi:transcriptional regulator
MYLPAHFREERLDVLHTFIREHGFATLVTQASDGLSADHIPLLLNAEAGPKGTLRGHVARANPVWKRAQPDSEVLVIFQGANGYVTPSWYATKRETGKVVPTWNYAAVHVHGPLRAIDDAEWLRHLVTDLTKVHESQFAQPWHVTDAPADFVDQMLKAIVGIEIPIARIEGKWKVSQNRPAVDREGVKAALRASGKPIDAAMADMVAAAEKPAGGH